MLDFSLQNVVIAKIRVRMLIILINYLFNYLFITLWVQSRVRLITHAMVWGWGVMLGYLDWTWHSSTRSGALFSIWLGLRSVCLSLMWLTSIDLLRPHLDLGSITLYDKLWVIWNKVKFALDSWSRSFWKSRRATYPAIIWVPLNLLFVIGRYLK
jgi:hypothetical protein